jgi:hypothetical protein
MSVDVDLLLERGEALPPTVVEPEFRDFFDYWRRKAPVGRLPGRQHIDPLDIPHLLPGTALFDVVWEADRYRFRFRLMGTRFVEAMGADYTGRFIDEVVLRTVKYEALYKTFRTIVKKKQPHYWETSITMPGREFIGLKRLALPLASDGRTIDMIFGYYVPVVGSSGG